MKTADKQAKERYLKQLAFIKSGAAANPFESKQEQQARIARAKKDVGYFVHYYLPHYATATSADFQIHLARQVARQKTGKFIIRWGRGLAKSVWCDVVIPLWLWINNDTRYMVIVGNNFDKAKILLSDLQAEFEANPRLIHDFGEQRMLGSWEDGYFNTKSGFIAKALGMGQSPRGLRLKAQRPDYIVCDDLEDKDTVKNPKRQDDVVHWIEHDLLPTMDGDTRRYLHPNNNFSPRSIQEELHIRHPEWALNQVNAYNPITYEPAWLAKYDFNYYRDIESEIGILAAKAEYNNEPHTEGKIFTEAQIQWLEKYPKLSDFKILVGHWDIAYSGKHDCNAMRIWGLKDKHFYYIDSFVRQAKMWDVLEYIADFMFNLPDNVIIHWQYEAQFWNDAVKDTIAAAEQQFGLQFHLNKVDTPRTKKYDRILRLQPYYQNKRIFYPKHKKGDRDLLEGLNQLYGIEPGYNTHDDAPDADEQAIAFLERHIRHSNFNPRSGTMQHSNKRKF
jgi:phage terminase large subunit-like protein